MASVSFDTSEVRALEADLRMAPGNIAPKVKAVVIKGAVNIKKDMQADMAASASFGAIAKNIGFDMIDGTDSVAAEIGMKRRTPGAADPNSGIDFGANIAYFGGPRGGGGVEDPRTRLNDEMPKFEKALGDVLDGIL